MLLYQAIYATFCIAFAYLNAVWIKKDKRIYHGLNGFLHIASGVLCGWLYWWPCFFIILCNSRAIFDTSLNHFRGLGLNYVSPKPKSWVDRIEKAIFGSDAITPRIIYLCVSVILNTIYIVFIND